MTSSKQEIERKEVIPLFPTFVWKYQLKEKVYQELNAQLLNALQAMRPSDAPLPAGKNWQTEQNLHTLPEFSALMARFTAAAKSVLTFQKVAYESFQITGSWANFSAKGATHRQHTHPNNFLSGVYYVQAGEGAKSITFTDPRPQRMVIDPHLTALDATNAGEITMEVNEGMMVLFPSWLIHSVLASTSEKERISISFNVMFNQYAESMCHPKWQSSDWPEPY